MIKKVYSYFVRKIEEFDKDDEVRVIILFEDNEKRDNFLSKHKNLDILNKFEFLSLINLNLTIEQVKNLEKDDLIKSIEEDQKLYQSIININEILDLKDYKESQIHFTGKDVKIGIIDNGINKNYGSISDVSIEVYKFAKNNKQEISHGTIMANIISNQYLDSNHNFIGIAPHATLFDFDISNSKNSYYFSDIFKVIDLINIQDIKIDILFIPFITANPSDGKDILSMTCNTLVDKGVIVICPAGNLGPGNYTIGSPGAAEKVITVGSLSKDLSLSNFSGRGPTLDERLKPDFCLPGAKILLPLTDKLSINVSGTSVSAAIGVGIIALIKEFNPEASYLDILEIVKQTSINLGFQKNSQGYGMINVVNIFKKLDLYEEKIIPYNYLMKRSFKTAIELFIILILFYYIFYFF